MELIFDDEKRRTQVAYLGMRVLGTPFWSLLSMLLFILYKNGLISPVEITVMVALKPMTSIFAPYWSHRFGGVQSLRWANVLRFFPFLFLPWMGSGAIIVSFGLFMMLSRATIPAWMEVLKSKLSEERSGRLIGLGTTVDYCGLAVMTLFFGMMLDRYPECWRWLFAGTALLGLVSTVLVTRLTEISTSLKRTFDLKREVVEPWRSAWSLLRGRRDFALFQLGFMLGGAGLMIIQPALPKYFVDTLNLSYVEMGLALAFCKGIGVALSSAAWARLFGRLPILTFSAIVTLMATLFPLMLLMTPLNVLLLYFAYIFYGIMQGGSELSWHMSGMVFSKGEDSSAFSSLNVLTVGLRGCVIPTLGALLLPFFGTTGVIVLGALLCALATLHFLSQSRTLTISP